MKYFISIVFVLLALPLFMANTLETHPMRLETQSFLETPVVQVVPQNLMSEASAFFSANRSEFPNSRYITVVDFSLPSTQERMFITDMQSGVTRAIHVAHGSGSDPKNDGYATKFSDSNGTHMSSLGFYRVSELRNGKHGVEISLDGLSDSNKHVRQRLILIHSADYVHDSDVIQGRSWGCFAVSLANHDWVVQALSGGSLMYVGLSKE